MHDEPPVCLAVFSGGGWAGFGLLGLALMAIWTAVLPQREALVTLRDQLQTSHSLTGSGTIQATSPGRQSSEFLRQLPTRRDVPAILGVVLQQAKATGLDLESGTYDWRPAKDGGVGQYRIALPVHGSYPSIRQFIEKTLAASPAVALESLHFAREQVEDSAIDADISFVIYMGSS